VTWKQGNKREAGSALFARAGAGATRGCGEKKAGQKPSDDERSDNLVGAYNAAAVETEKNGIAVSGKIALPARA
jgi:hypothetical protein